MVNYPQSAAGGEKMAKKKGQEAIAETRFKNRLEAQFPYLSNRQNSKLLRQLIPDNVLVQIIDVADTIVYANVEPTEGRWAGAELVRLATFPNCGVCAGDNHIGWVELETTIRNKAVVSVTAYVSLHCNDGDCEWSIEVPADF